MTDTPESLNRIELIEWLLLDTNDRLNRVAEQTEY
jgi:hypothetical protein